MEKTVEPDDKEAVVTQSEHRVRMAIQRDADEKWKTRMDREDKNSANHIEAVHSDVVRLSAKKWFA